MRDKSNSPERDPEVELAKILKNDKARLAFDELCRAGCDRRWLTMRLLWMRDYEPVRNRTLFVNPKVSHRLSKKVAALLREIDDSGVVSWRRTQRKVEPSAEYEPPILNALTMRESPFRRRSPVILDVNILREQLRAAALYFARVGKAKKPIAYGVHVKGPNSNLKRLLNMVKESTGRAHYREIEILCTAATSGRFSFDPDALKMRVHRARKK